MIPRPFRALNGPALVALGLMAWVCVLVPMSASADADEAVHRGRAALGAREAAIRSLVQFLDNEQVFEQQPEQAAQAVEMLGRLKAEEGIPVLLEHIAFLPKPVWREAFRHYPCAVALARIGVPAAAGLVELAAADDEGLGYGAVEVLRVVYQSNALAALHLRVVAETELDPKRRARLSMWADNIAMLGDNLPFMPE
ncbi:MAG: hypothetical protein J7M38_07395 [Armatimonadetes bacterium]|nr:hypothetical protein [Armatimonadota bacterium]